MAVEPWNRHGARSTFQRIKKIQASSLPAREQRAGAAPVLLVIQPAGKGHIMWLKGKQAGEESPSPAQRPNAPPPLPQQLTELSQALNDNKRASASGQALPSWPQQAGAQGTFPSTRS